MQKHQRYGLVAMFFGLALVVNNTAPVLAEQILNIMGLLTIAIGAYLLMAGDD